jgi:hypothetical protein
VCFEPVLGWPSTLGLSSARAHVDVKMLSRPGLQRFACR